MMLLLRFFVLSAIVVVSVRSIPQVFRTFRSNSVAGVSPASFALSVAGSLLWATWAVADGKLVALPGSLVGGSCAAAALFALSRQGARMTVSLLAAAGYIVFGAVMFLVYGPLALSLTAACSGVGFAVFGLSAFLRSPDRAGVSLWSWGLVAYSELVWLCWGLVYRVPASIISSGSGVLAALVVMGLSLHSSRRKVVLLCE